MKNQKLKILICSVALIQACAPKDRPSSISRDRNNGVIASPSPGSGSTPETETEPLSEQDWPSPLKHKINDKYFGTLLCENGPQVVAKGEKTNLDKIFTIICNKNSPTKILGQLFDGAYDGSNSPSVKTILFDVNDYFITQFTYGFAIKSKLRSPSRFSGLPIYAEFGKGLVSGDSLIYIKQTSERSFPGKGVVTEINLDYDLPFAEGAALYDKRQTQMNTYLLTEATQDINITVENLLNADQNKIYQTSNSLILGVKGEPGETYLVYVVELILTNRFDPGRVQRTLSEMAKKVQESVHRLSQNAE